MKENILIEIPIKQGVEVSLDGDILKIKGKNGEIKKDISSFTFSIKISKDKIVLEHKNSGRKQKSVVYTMQANIKNMMHGVENPFKYELQICNVHFPVTVSVDEKNKLLLVKNFLAETRERKAKILENTKVEVKGDRIFIKSVDIDAAGQTAANIETATKVRNKDRRVFQDGIFIIEKAGEKIV